MSSDQQTVLVTGAAGCIGAWVTMALVREGASVLAFDRSDDRHRLGLLLGRDEAVQVPWQQGDIADFDALERLIGEHGIGTIVHLAAMQVPFCRADPIAGARVNVVGMVNVMEAARRHGIRNLVYASSIAALPLAGETHPSTIYGVYKIADEGIAQRYWLDYGVPSIGLRPHAVYGVGRDQGLTSAPTKAMLAAAAGRPYEIPFSGGLQLQHAGDVAADVLRCAHQSVEGAPVFNLGGPPIEVAEIPLAIERVVDGAEITVSGPPLPFPYDQDRADLDDLIGQSSATSLNQGIAATVAAFRDLLDRGLLSPEVE